MISSNSARLLGRGGSAKRFLSKRASLTASSSRGGRNSSIRLPRMASAAVALQRNQLLFYSTERVLELRNKLYKNKEKQPKVLYNPKHETDNCGVGLIASLKSTPSRHVVDVADEMLVRMSHRGGCGCDPASGDGAGK